MEEVLDVYERPMDPKNPVICFDERHGTAVVLLAVEPLSGKRIVEVREQRTKKDYAEFMQSVVEHYPQAKKITLVQDNLNTHNPSSFYETFSAERAFELSKHFEMIYTPKKASWLNMAEIEFSTLSKQCLDRRIADLPTLEKEVDTWTRNRNRKEIKIEWQFTKTKARQKFQRLYSEIKK